MFNTMGETLKRVQEITIFVLGDSIAYGLLDEELGGWVNRLRLYLESKKT